MTPYQQRILDHLVEVATGVQRNLPPQKSLAWDMAKRYADIDPYELADMPDLLKKHMLETQAAQALPLALQAIAKARG